MNLLPAIQALGSTHERRPGGHNWQDLELVIDTADTAVVNDGIYMLQVLDREPVVKRLRHLGENQYWLHPAVATVHDVKTIQLVGRKIPCQTVEFSDNIYKRHITIHGRVIGLWAGVAQ